MPLSVDMPLEQLKIYQGSSVKPHDFDEYWNNILKKREKFSNDIKIEKKNFKLLFVNVMIYFFKERKKLKFM